MASCTTCARTMRCNWSLERQTCENLVQANGEGEYLARDEEDCPRYTVDGNSFVKAVNFRRSVVVLNGKVDYLSFLRKSQIKCHFGNIYFNGSVVDDRIVCDRIRIPSAGTTKVALVHACVSVNGVQVKFDNDEDYFITVYDRLCPTNNTDCFVCAWHDDQKRNYLKMCAAGNRCIGLAPIYGARDVITDKSWINNDHVVHIGETCPDVHVKSVHPRLGLLRSNGYTTFTIVVNNHRILSFNRTMAVTVAGQECVEPSAVSNRDNGTITCTVHAFDASKPIKGPVRVTYMSAIRTSGHYDYEVTSGVINVTFANEPVISSIEPICGYLYGYTNISMRGENLDVGDTVIVTVGETVKCEAVERWPNNIRCRIPPVRGIVDNHLRVEFDQLLNASLPLDRFGFSDLPVLSDGQTFGGIASGGTTIPVSGDHFECVEIARVSIYRNSKNYIGGECLVRNDSYMECQSPKLNDVSAKTSIIFNLSVTVFGHDTFAIPSPDFPEYTVYPDPEFMDFETDDNRTVTINGRNLDLGYEFQDIDVRFENSTTRCTVIERTTQWIRCECNNITTIHIDKNISDVVVVTIGQFFIVQVPKKYVQNSASPSSAFFGDSILRFGIWALTIVVFVVGSTFTYLLIKKFQNSQTSNIRTPVELYPLDDPPKHTAL